jgi:hypothetical protein
VQSGGETLQTLRLNLLPDIQDISNGGFSQLLDYAASCLGRKPYHALVRRVVIPSYNVRSARLQPDPGCCGVAISVLDCQGVLLS